MVCSISVVASPPGSDLTVTVEAKQLQMLQAGIPKGLIVDHHVTQYFCLRPMESIDLFPRPYLV